jgi:hypothetical protein
MKYLKRYNESFETSIQENFLTDLKNKVKSGINKLKGKLFISSIYSILPKDLLLLIKSEVGKLSTNESYDMLFENLFPNIKSIEELENMSDKEYNSYLNELSSDIEFKVDIEGNPLQNEEFFNFLKEKGIPVNTSIVHKSKPSMYKIDKMINNMTINPIAKKLIKGLSYCLFFYMIFIKVGGGTAYANDHHSDHFDKKLDTEKDTKISDSIKSGPMEEFLNKYAGDKYFIATGESKYDFETAKTEALLKGGSKNFTSSSIVEEKAFKSKDGKTTYIIVYKK